MKLSLLLTSLILLSTTTFAAENEIIDTTKIYSINEITVHSYRSNIPLVDAPNKVEIISDNDIKTSGATNITDLIKKNVNADAVDMQGVTGGIDFRGFAPAGTGTNSYTRLLVDGIPMSTRNTAATSLLNLSSVEILKGPFSAIYGSGAMGGVINLITPQTKGRIKGGGNIGFGSYNTTSISAYAGGNITKKLDFDIYGEFYNQNKDYKTGGHNLLKMSEYDKEVMDPHSYSAIYKNSRYDKKSGGLRLGYDINDRWRINLSNDIYYTGRGRGNGGFWGIEDQTDKKIFRNAHHADVTGVMGNHTLKISPFFSFEKSDYDNSGMYGDTKSRYNYSTWGGIISDVFKFSSHSITFGIDNFSQKYVSQQWDSENARIAPFNPDYSNIQTGIFAEGNFAFLNNKLTSVIGLRYDNILFKTYNTPYLESTPDTKSYNTFNPNVALKYKITDKLSVRGSVGTAYLAPDAFKMTGDYIMWGTKYKGNPDLKAEQSLTYDFGVGFINDKRSLMADVTIFYTNHKNLIISEFVSEGSYMTYINANQANVGGLEYMLSADFGRMFDKDYSLELYASFTHIFRSDVNTPTGKTEREYVSRNTANFGISFLNRKFSARINGRYIGSKLERNFVCVYDSQGQRVPFISPEGFEVRPALVNDEKINTPNFMVFDISASYNILEWMQLSVKLNNVLDENYFERDSYYMPGRNFTVQLGFNF